MVTILTGLAACSRQASVVSDQSAPAASEHPATHEDAAHDQDEGDALPLPKRLAFMTGHVEAGLALYRAGEPRMAAKHLLHPVSETHAGERVGLDALGFDAALFVAVSEALDNGVPAQQIEPQLLAAQANLAAVAARAGGDPADIIGFLIDTVIEEYRIGVRDGVVADMGEYQDAFGFTKVAISRAQALDGNVQRALNALLQTWPNAPIPPQVPVDPATIARLVADVRAALAADVQ